MKKAIFITVRTSSTRLPKKCLLEIEGKKTIEVLIERLKRSKSAEMIIVCTTTNPKDDILCEIAQKNGVEHFRGVEKDKLERWRATAKEFDVDFFVTADGDDLFCETELIDMAFSQYGRNKPDFIESKGLVAGAFTYGIKTTALEKVCEIKDTEETEMMWVYFTDTGLFKTEMLENVPDVYKRPEIRMTLDYEDDFKFFENVIKHLSKLGKEYNLRDIIAYLDENPDVIKINQYLEEQFTENQKNKTKLVLKKGYNAN
jgi:spore coat polysaccharide biosynthesis protein SpsF|tara:strand:- start:185 stop:958 length:774 start_codon:yes stop_codon:yes gene_type:complete